MRWALLFAPMLALADTAPIADENLRVAALHAIFPGMEVTVTTGRHVHKISSKKTWPGGLDFPDVLAREREYMVVAPAANEIEREASLDVASLRASSKRLVRFQLFPRQNSEGMVAVVQYKFDGIFPALAVESIGLIVALEYDGGRWEVKDRYLLETNRHLSIQTIRILRLGESTIMIVEADLGGPGTIVSRLHVFDLAQTKFEEILALSSMVSGIDGVYQEVLDIPKTDRFDGMQFCFTKTTFLVGEKILRPPRKSARCYELGEGLDRRNEPLKP